MKSAGKARNNGLYRHIRTSKEIIRNLLNDLYNYSNHHTSSEHDIETKALRSFDCSHITWAGRFTDVYGVTLDYLMCRTDS